MYMRNATGDISSTSRTNDTMEVTVTSGHADQKWEKSKRNLCTGDVVLVKEEGAYRNDWPIGRVPEAIVSDDGQVRKVQVEIVRGFTMKTFLCQIKKLVLLVPVPAENHELFTLRHIGLSSGQRRR